MYLKIDVNSDLWDTSMSSLYSFFPRPFHSVIRDFEVRDVTLAHIGKRTISGPPLTAESKDLRQTHTGQNKDKHPVRTYH